MSRSRRWFLKELAAGVAAAAIPPRVFGLRAAARAHRVLVVGAGPAGLTAAFELARAGHEVAVFEARSRPGGRIYTLRDFDDGLYAEAGATYLVSHNPGLEYARDFGLELMPLPFRPDLGTVAHVAGARVVQRARVSHSWPVELPDEDRGLSIIQLQTKYHRTPIHALEGFARLHEEGFPQEEFLDLDAMSLAEYWRKNGASEAAVRLMRLRYYDGYGEGIETVSTLQLAREAASLARLTGSFQVTGGNDRICAELAARIPGEVVYDSPVITIRQDDSGVRIVVEQRGRRQEVAGDYVIVTAPLEVLSRIAFTPPLSPLRARAIAEVRGTDVTRVYVQTRRRFWEGQGLDGSAITDLPIGAINHVSIGQRGQRGILESFTYGERARAMARLSDNQRVSSTRAAMELVLPGVEAQAERGASYSWGEDPWARGGHTAFAPGQIGTFFHALQRPERRVFFAGDAVGGYRATRTPPSSPDGAWRNRSQFCEVEMRSA